MLRICPEMWDYPVCFPTIEQILIHGKGMYISVLLFIGDILYIYLPIELGFHQTDRFENIFSNIGKVVC